MQKIASGDHPMYNFSKPKRTGPGVWYMFMLMSAHAKTPAEMISVCNHIRLFCDFFGCGECSGDCKIYISKNSPEDSIGTDRGLFDWVVEFMNAVNYKLGKPGYNKDILYRMVTEKGINFCEGDCNGDKKIANKANSVDQKHTGTLHLKIVGKR